MPYINAFFQPTERNWTGLKWCLICCELRLSLASSSRDPSVGDTIFTTEYPCAMVHGTVHNSQARTCNRAARGSGCYDVRGSCCVRYYAIDKKALFQAPLPRRSEMLKLWSGRLRGTDTSCYNVKVPDRVIFQNNAPPDIRDCSGYQAHFPRRGNAGRNIWSGASTKALSKLAGASGGELCPAG